jgi:DNA-binding CsgD family transcriptional regulator
VPAQMVETPVEVEDLLRLLLDQVEDKEQPIHGVEGSGLTPVILLKVRLNGAQYTLTRQQASISAPGSSAFTLSPRELEVVRLVAKGFSNKAIATVLDISPWTVSTYLRRIFSKMDVGSRAEMIMKALQEKALNWLIE